MNNGTALLIYRQVQLHALAVKSFKASLHTQQRVLHTSILILTTSAKVALPIDTHERERPQNKMAGDETKPKYDASS